MKIIDSLFCFIFSQLPMMSNKRKQTSQTSLIFFIKRDQKDDTPAPDNTDVTVTTQSEESNCIQGGSKSSLDDSASESSEQGHVLDIGNFVKSTIDDATRYNILKNCWEPPLSFQFPTHENKGGHKRRFQRHWMSQFPWLAYSQIKNGFFCKVCVLFGQETGGISKEVRLLGIVTVPFNKWKNALEYFKSHETTKYHQANIISSSNFTKNFWK